MVYPISMLRRLLKHHLIRCLAILLLAPYALALLYIFLPPPSTLMLADLATFTLPRRNWVSLDAVSPDLVVAVVASEDSAFCEHWGFDFKQVEHSIKQAQRGKKLRGASTITQQTAKNLFLWNGRSWLRKALEAPLTLWLELVLSKRRILEIYLNIAQWGPAIYGAQAGAQHHFGLNASQLSARQAALLASALPNPKHMRPAQAGVILNRMRHNGPDLSCVR